MELGYRSLLVDHFRRGEVARDVRLLAAQGALAPRAQEQLVLLAMLTADSDPLVAAQAEATLGQLPGAALRAFLARPEVTPELRSFFQTRGVAPSAGGAGDNEAPLIDTLQALPEVPETEEGDEAQARILSSMPIIDRVKLAMKGTREQRAQLIRDANRLVAAAVLSSPKLTDSEVEAFAKMANVSEEVLRVIASNRTWTKSYTVVLGLARNPKTPPAISMKLLHRLNERDAKMLAVDRNVPEALRLAARKMAVKKLG